MKKLLRQYRYFLFCIAAACGLLIAASTAQAQYLEEDNEVIAVSPKPGWDPENPIPARPEHSLGAKIALWLPNRILDLIDIFKVDVGVGPAAGVVIRVTKYGQVGYRQMFPGSLRFGLMGRDWPLMMENSSEFGAGPLFVESDDREVSVAEVGVGADLFIVGAYAGISLDGVVDFLGGIVGFDPEKDDL